MAGVQGKCTLALSLARVDKPCVDARVCPFARVDHVRPERTLRNDPHGPFFPCELPGHHGGGRICRFVKSQRNDLRIVERDRGSCSGSAYGSRSLSRLRGS